MKRFWRDVAVEPGEAGYGITLDSRPVRTPGRLLLAVPGAALAEAIAAEWRGVGEDIDPRAMPLTGLANAAIERVAADVSSFAANLARYGESDLLYYRAEEPPPLVTRQREAWDPLLHWAQARYDVHFETTAGVMHHPQPPATLARLHHAVEVRSPFELAGLSPVITITGSLIVGLALIEGAASAEAIWNAARIDEAWQEELWGLDPLAEAATAAHRAEFDAGVAFLGLL